VPRIQAEALRAAGVGEREISVIPDEQDAITAALNMGQPGDLLLIFADALARSWKQITKFKPAGTAVSPPPPVAKPAERVPLTNENEPMVFSLEGLIRDERGVRLAPDAED
jgi:cyanophycin synthetase